MSSIEDKILNGPTVQYCDADDNDIRSGQDIDENHEYRADGASSLFIRPNEDSERPLANHKIRAGSSSLNTGPKGVIEDYKNRSLSKDKQHDDHNNLEAEFEELLNDDSILKEIIAKRIAKSKQIDQATFGHVQHLKSGTELLDAIDKENPNVLVMVHIYTKYSKPCANLNRCLRDLASDLRHIKFVTLDASATGLSANFKENGVPALLAYRRGELVKSLVQLEELLDKDFDTNQVKELLYDNGLVG